MTIFTYGCFRKEFFFIYKDFYSWAWGTEKSIELAGLAHSDSVVAWTLSASRNLNFS